MVDVFDREYERTLFRETATLEFKFLKPYKGEESIDIRVNGKHEHYCHEYSRLNMLLKNNGLSLKDRKILEKEMERALKLSLESV